MATLSSILVQHGAVTMRAVEDAIARQVFHGGDLATNLLEIGAVREEVLAPLLAESVGLPAAPWGPLPAPEPRVLRLIPGELALRHGIFPLEQADRALVVATAEPLAAAIEDDLGFALDLSIRQVVAPLVRVRQAIAEHYGIPLQRRYLRLVARLDGTADPSPSAAPPPGRGLMPLKMPRPISIPSPTFGTGVPSFEPDSARLTDALPASKTPFVAAHDFVNPRIPRSPGLPRDAEPAPEPTPASPVVAVSPEPPVASPAPPVAVSPEPPAAVALPESPVAVASPEPPPVAAPSEPPAAAALPVPPAAVAPPEPPETAFLPTERAAPLPARRLDPDGTRALAGVVRRALRAERTSAPLDKTARPAWRSAHRRKGPFTAAMAERELEEAAASEAVLEIVFAFAAQFFTYTVIFVVQGDLAEGRDSVGPGADRATVSAIGVPLDLPGSLALARDRRGPVVTRLSADGLDADLARDLGRSPRAVGLLPVLVRARVVAILYGDDGEADVELSALGEVLAVIGLAGSALERIALRKKLAGRLPEIPHPVRILEAPADPGQVTEARAQGVAALARAVVTPEPPPVEPDPAIEIHAEVEADAVPLAAAPAEAAVATFSAPADDAPADSSEDAAFAVAPPDDSVLPPSQGPRTARYFDEPRAEPPVVVTSLKQTVPGMGIVFPDTVTPPPPEVEPLPDPTPAPEARVTRRLESNPTRRGVAPIFEGRSAAKAAAAPGGFEPLPSRPPPNATAWTTFPSTPPPEAVIAPRQRSERPIPREEHDDVALPRAPRAPHLDHASLPSVVVDVGAEYHGLITRFLDGGRGSQEAFAEMVRNGEQVVAAVMARFPGPLRVDRHRARGELPAASQCGPVLEVLVAIRRPALPFVSVRLSSVDPEIRFWAAHVLGELRYPEAATALLPRLFDDDLAVRRIVRRSATALVGAGAAGAPLLKGLEDILQNREEPVPNRVLCAETMGEIRSGAFVPSLVAALEQPSSEIVEAARRALAAITRQDFGDDLDRWRGWWAQSGKRHRIEWLIDALMNDQPALRRAAGDELKALTKEYFGYYDDLPKRERERAQQLYRTWWEREGRARFAS
jgi:hypothetical protein